MMEDMKMKNPTIPKTMSHPLPLASFLLSFPSFADIKHKKPIIAKPSLIIPYKLFILLF